MSPHAPTALIVEHLQQAIEQLHRDALRVEIWAGALRGFAEPIPQYDSNEDFLLRPGRPGGPPIPSGE